MAKQAAPLSSTSETEKLTNVDFFGPPPLIGNENAAAYNDLLARVTVAMRVLARGRRARRAKLVRPRMRNGMD